ncbi:MAG: phosphohydrolase [Nitrospinae bacterium CG22_combo_CG10-13_8_21_14_all_47_10]|jgi:HD-like signal output (HDOD) protein|nr:MAG: phosphohydrolase [Nitrospinae bacterium CG22_combo_CG10-13_8_21_14_all_47_10]
MALDIEKAIKDWVGSPPNVYVKLKQTLEDPRSSFKEFAAIIGHDPSLSARLLKVVNSAFYGLENKVETITHALGIIGTEQLTQLVLATSVTKQFSGIPENLVSMDLFWRHSIACGVTAKIIADWVGERNLESYYLAGMLHDIGSLVIYKKFPVEAEKVLTRCKENKEHLFDVEREVFGASHAKVGGKLLAGWGLPMSLCEPVFFHHRPQKAKEYSLATKIIHVADSIVDEMNLGSSGEALPNPVDLNILNELGFSELPTHRFESKIKDQYYTAMSLFI